MHNTEYTIRDRAKAGFTLIELLVVISIIGVLTALLLANFVGIRERAADLQMKSNANELKKALRLYYNEFQSYPASSGTATILGCGANGVTACTEGAEFGAGSNSYMRELPDLSRYAQNNNGDGFYACVELQNNGDPDIASSQNTCGVSSGGSEESNSDFCVCND